MGEQSESVWTQVDVARSWHTARSRPPNPPGLATHNEELNMEGDQSPIQLALSPDYDPAEARHEAEGIETHTTPRISRKTRSITSSQRDPARNPDPHNGRCLITNRPYPVQSCHFVAQATNHETVRVCVSQITRLYSLPPTHSSRNWSMRGA